MKSFSFSILVLSSTIAACGTSGSGPDAAADSGSPADSGTQTDTGAAHDTGVPVDSGGAPDTGVGDTGSSTETTYMLPIGDCFTFATATSMDAMSMSCGDMLALSGENVDLESPSGPDGMGGFCPVAGTFTSVTAVPTSYASCAWTSYVEGGDSLANTGYIVRDATQTHHYRMHVVSNAQPALIFAFAAID